MTLFGISEKKKRGIVVPVMALAVCAVAMVGLGFALETSVTSSSNDVQILAIDLEDSFDGFNGQKSPDKDSVNKLFKPTISTKKSTNASNETVIQYMLESGSAYLKVFDNTVDDATLRVSFGEKSLRGMSISLQEMTGADTTSGNPIPLDVGGNAVDIKTNTIYKVSVIGVTLPVKNSSNCTVSNSGWSESVTYGSSDTIYDISSIVFDLTFTAEKQ